MSFLARIPLDSLLLIVDLLQPEDSLRLIQTCKSLYSLTTIKAFWLACGKMLQQRRWVHYLPLEQLDISQLRTTILRTLKLDSKWPGRGEIGPSPTRCLQIDTTSLNELPARGRAVTWVWFLEDGIHLICVVNDTLVQLWNLLSNKSILTFDVGGRLMYVSHYSDKDHLLIAGSVSVFEGVGGMATNPAFTVWKYNWDTTVFVDRLLPITIHVLPAHPLYIIINKAVVGAVYVTENFADFPPVETQDHTGYLTFLLMEWRGTCRPTRRFTPMSFFGAYRTLPWKTPCIRTLTHLSILFDTRAGVVVYSYDWAVVSDLAVQQPAPGVEVPYAEIIYPRLKATYALGPEQSKLFSSMRLLWSHACLLWNGQKVGIVGSHLSADSRRKIFSLAVLDLSPLLAHDGRTPNHDLQEQYVRRIVSDGTYKPPYPTNNRLQISQPRHTTSIIWVLNSPNGPNVATALALARYMPPEVSQTGSEIKTPHAIPLKVSDAGVEIPATQQPLTEHKDLGIKCEEHFLRIGLDGWIPKSEQTENIDLDDRLGRVVFGMNSGKVYILEFV